MRNPPTPFASVRIPFTRIEPLVKKPGHEFVATKLLVPQSSGGNKRGSYVQWSLEPRPRRGAPIESSKKQGRAGVRRGLRGADMPRGQAQWRPDRERPSFKCWKSDPFSPPRDALLKHSRVRSGCSALTRLSRRIASRRGRVALRRGGRSSRISAVTSWAWRALTHRRRGGLRASHPGPDENVAA
jgi:hypothetical protein